MSVLTISVSFVVSPVTIVNVAVSVNESSLAVGLVSLPVPLVDTAITPNLVSLTMSKIFLVPFTFIASVVLQSLHVLLHQVRLVSIRGLNLVIESSQIRSDFLHSLVLSLDLLLAHSCRVSRSLPQ